MPYCVYIAISVQMCFLRYIVLAIDTKVCLFCSLVTPKSMIPRFVLCSRIRISVISSCIEVVDFKLKNKLLVVDVFSLFVYLLSISTFLIKSVLFAVFDSF